MNKTSRIFIAGSDTLIGGAILNNLRKAGFERLYSEKDLNNALDQQQDVEKFFSEINPEYVFHAAGKTGGILANQQYPADLMMDNLQKTAHIIITAHRYQTKKLIYIASSCSYPRVCRQPMIEDSLFSGPLEPTNQAYAMAKLAGIQLCLSLRDQYSNAFIPAIPTNYFGPGDHFDPQNSHVIEALISRMHEAKHKGSKCVSIWGSGKARREFLYVEDIAEAAIFVMQNYIKRGPVNLGGGVTLSIQELAETIRGVIGFKGDLVFDATKPDGMPEKSLDNSKLSALNWQPKVKFRQALIKTYDWFVKNKTSIG